MKPVLALLGRPNVGKSTLFNCLTRTRDALVADQPGLTRDRQFGVGRLGSRPYIVVDTGGLSDESEGIDDLMRSQVMQAITDADAVLFLVDGRAGLTAGDEAIMARLRPYGKRIVLVVNKSEGLNSAECSAEFMQLGIAEVHTIAAAHQSGVHQLIEDVLAPFPAAVDEESEEEQGIRIAVVGRPNVGKSTLVNRILGEERVVAYDQPGTTRDSIFIPFVRDGQDYTLIDTAGVRRRSRVTEAIEKFSVIKTLQAVTSAHVVIQVLDARQGVSDQDARLLGLILESGRALVIAINKWDGLDAETRERIRSDLDRKLAFVDFARCHYISALHGSGVGELFDSIRNAYKAGMRKLSTPNLTRLLEAAVAQHQPPIIKGRRIKLRYAHQGGHNPPLIIIHGNQASAVPDDYRRYLVNYFRKHLHLEGTPVRIEFRSGDNPFKGRKNELSQRQVARRKRLKRFTKRSKRSS
jgi:GTP-binding protein